MFALSSRPGAGIFLTLCLASLALSPAGLAQTTTPVVTAVGSGMGGTTSSAVAPGGLITITGTNLATTTGDLSSYTTGPLPTQLANTRVTIAGRQAPLFMVTPTMIVAQVPFEVTTGTQTVTVTNSTTASAAFSVTVAATAPAIYANAATTGVVKAADYSLVGAGNPALPGETLLIYATGLGQTSPVMQTGVPYSSTALATASPVRVLVGGQAVTPGAAVAAPGFAGLYQVSFQVPSAASGTVPVQLATADSASTTSIIVGPLRAAALDPQIQAVFDQYRALGPKPIETLTPQEARQQPSFADAVRALLNRQGRSVAPEPVALVQDISVPGGAGTVPARVYTPQGTGPFPVIMYFHGGGFVIATNDTYDASPRALANAAGAIVISVEYRKAPENKFPAAVEDAYAAVQWAFTNAATYNGRNDRIAVAGESAGGNLATVVCMLARDRGGRMPLYQALVYPVATLATQSRSYEENGNAPFLTAAALRWFGSYYLNTMDEARNTMASPLLGNVNGLPPATVITAGFDPLRDEGAAYADKLRQAGITVDYRNYEAESHEFFGMGAVVDAARTAELQVGNNLKAAFAR